MATKSIAINVRKKHWQAALDTVKIVGFQEMQIQANQCPIAQALRDKFPDYFVNVFRHKVILGLAGQCSPVYLLSKAGGAVVEKFDSLEYDDLTVDWTQPKPKVAPALPRGMRLPKFPVKVVLSLRA